MIFLSASIPTPGKENYYESADVLAIQAAVRATVQVVIPKAKLIWGGHPAITTIIHHTIGRMNADLRDQLTLYQSDYFKAVFPKEHSFFADVKTIAETPDKKVSITKMRYRMIEENDFKAAIFIGGMKGVEKEYEIFREVHPQALLLPLASTGAAARNIYNQMPKQLDNRLLHDFEYVPLLKSLLLAYL